MGPPNVQKEMTAKLLPTVTAPGRKREDNTRKEKGSRPMFLKGENWRGGEEVENDKII